MNTVNTELVRYFNVVGVFDGRMLKDFLDFYEGCTKDGIENAVLMINSPGGSLYTLTGMLSVIENSNMTWWGVNNGQAYSCGLLLLAGCDYRYGSDRASYIWHDMTTGFYGNPDSIEEELRWTKEEKEYTFQKYADKVFHDLDWWMEKTKQYDDGDYKFRSDEALKNGVIDFLGFPNFNQNIIPEVFPYVISKDPEGARESVQIMRKEMELPDVINPDEKKKPVKKKPVKKSVKKSVKKPVKK